MKVSEILKKNEVTISCEIFPPKQGAQLQNYKAIAAEIAKLKPAYISAVRMVRLAEQAIIRWRSQMRSIHTEYRRLHI